MDNVDEFKENRCSKCMNRYNDRDLCYITRGIDGKLKCHNENSKDKEMVEIGKEEN